ncbi:MAG: glutamine--fructose-6-phosphate transaminase (isomerizing) [Pseudomonadota bacterium]|nr:glutamine--fructose-6-phosphate transaminase (isomerizing) [Pseudomonadota bacterium]
MCGIVGAVGQGPCYPTLLEGLRRLEYRGYDSSGIVTLDQKTNFRLCRSVGKLKNLDRKLKLRPIEGKIGIGHTRWATHGEVSEKNSHPHLSGDKVGIVHNGIIENYKAIRERLEKKNFLFSSDTDSEVLAHLFVEAFAIGLNPGQAVRSVMSQIQGTYAFAAISKDFPDIIIVARNASPLAIGVGEGGCYIGSDALALAHLTRKIIYLKDQDSAIVSQSRVEIFLSDGSPVQRDEIQVSAGLSKIDKAGFRHFMEKEIHEQPDAIANSLLAMTGSDYRLSTGISKEELRKTDGILMIAAGTSYYASLVARFWVERLAKIPVSCEVASEYHYRNPVASHLTTAIAISQSGESVDTLMALRHAAKLKLKTIALTNVKDSTIARESEFVLPTHAGPEIGVASTKAFTSQLSVLLIFSVVLAEARGQISKEKADEIHHQIQCLPGLVAQTLKIFERVKPIAKRLKSATSAIYLGRDTLFPIALEGALKLKELSYIHSEGFASGEMKHGPIALIDDKLPVIALLASNSLVNKSISNLKEASVRGARIILVAEKSVVDQVDFADDTIIVPSVDNLIAPILLAVPVQILAYLTALYKGTDVDQPRNLAKSVTVE